MAQGAMRSGVALIGRGIQSAIRRKSTQLVGPMVHLEHAVMYLLACLFVGLIGSLFVSPCGYLSTSLLCSFVCLLVAANVDLNVNVFLLVYLVYLFLVWALKLMRLHRYSPVPVVGSWGRGGSTSCHLHLL